MALKAIPQQEFQKCFQPWQHGWVKCITAQGKYFKGNHASVSCKYTDMLAVKQFRELYGHTSYFFGSLFFHLSLAGRGKCSSGCPFWEFSVNTSCTSNMIYHSDWAMFLLWPILHKQLHLPQLLGTGICVIVFNLKIIFTILIITKHENLMWE